jgi:hypothetical protein
LGGGTPVEGDDVLVWPWVGAPSVVIPPAQTSKPSTNVCRAVIFIGVRGSGQDPQAPLNYQSFSANSAKPNRSDGYGDEVRLALYNFDKELVTNSGNSDPAASRREMAIHYPALDTEQLNPFRFKLATIGGQSRVYPDVTGPGQYLASVVAGVIELRNQLIAEYAQCPSERVVLAGYSQGALVVHEALEGLSITNPAVTNSDRIAKVMLLADPARDTNTSGNAQGTAAADAVGTAVFTPEIAGWVLKQTNNFALGLGGRAAQAAAAVIRSYPSELQSQTTSICNLGDIVCDANHWLKIGAAAWTQYLGVSGWFCDTTDGCGTSQDGVTVHTGYGGKVGGSDMIIDWGHAAADSIIPVPATP